MGLACNSKHEKGIVTLPGIYSRMFKDGLKNESTAPDYVVYIAKNSKTGESKEICTTTLSANSGRIIDFKTRTIVFTDSKFKQLGANNYNKKLVEKNYKLKH